MSSYTIGEIIVWLLAAAVLGFVLGWLVRELVLRRHSRPASASAPVEPSPAAPVVEPEPEPVPEPEPEPEAEPDPDPVVVVAGPHAGSALPVDGGDPPSPAYVVKVSKGSKIFHAPSSPAYARTTAALWFESPEAAEAAGFRRPKNG
jgi:hypothetical protein